jgi:hypothetical protein
MSGYIWIEMIVYRNVVEIGFGRHNWAGSSLADPAEHCSLGSSRENDRGEEKSR